MPSVVEAKASQKAAASSKVEASKSEPLKAVAKADSKEDVLITEKKKSNPYSMTNQDDMPFAPPHTTHYYTASRYNRVGMTLEAPSSFSGKPGTYKVGVRDGNVFFLSVLISPALVNPSHILTWLSFAFGRMFGDDSAKETSMNKSAQELKGKKWAKFEKVLDFDCQETVADDLGHGGFLWVDLDMNGKEVSYIHVELRGKEQLPGAEDSEAAEVTKTTFKSPVKKVAAKGVRGPTAQKAAMMEMMMEMARASGSKASSPLKRDGLTDGMGLVDDDDDNEDEDAMDVDTMNEFQKMMLNIFAGGNNKKARGMPKQGDRDDSSSGGGTVNA